MRVAPHSILPANSDAPYRRIPKHGTLSSSQWCSQFLRYPLSLTRLKATFTRKRSKTGAGIDCADLPNHTIHPAEFVPDSRPRVLNQPVPRI